MEIEIKSNKNLAITPLLYFVKICFALFYFIVLALLVCLSLPFFVLSKIFKKPKTEKFGWYNCATQWQSHLRKPKIEKWEL